MFTPSLEHFLTVVFFFFHPLLFLAGPGASWLFFFFVCTTRLFPGIDDIDLFLFILASYKRSWLHHCVIVRY